jgi:hypothetical protein
MRTLCRGSSLASLILMALMLAGCASNSTDSDDTYGSARFIHSAPSTELIDFTYLVYDSDTYADIANQVPYGEQRGYFMFLTGSRTFRAYLSGTSLSAASVTVSLAEHQKYTVIACDLDAAINPSLLAYADTAGAPDSGKVFLRFIHASADAPILNVLKADDTPLVTDLERYQASGYVELDAGTYDFTATSSGTGAELLALDPLTLTSGLSYTVILSGSAYVLPGPVLNAIIYQETGVE